MGLDGLRWVQMGSDGFRWAQMGSDGLDAFDLYMASTAHSKMNGYKQSKEKRKKKRRRSYEKTTNMTMISVIFVIFGIGVQMVQYHPSNGSAAH